MKSWGAKMSPQVGVVVRAQLDAISTALAELQSLRSQFATLKPRKPIGFIQPVENDEEDKAEKK